MRGARPGGDVEEAFAIDGEAIDATLRQFDEHRAYLRGKADASAANMTDSTGSDLLHRIETLCAEMLQAKNQPNLWREMRPYFVPLRKSLGHIKSAGRGETLSAQHFSDIHQTIEMLVHRHQALGEFGLENDVSTDGLAPLIRGLSTLFGEGDTPPRADISLDPFDPEAQADVERAETLQTEAENQALAAGAERLADHLWALVGDLETGPGRILGFRDLDGRRRDIATCRGTAQFAGLSLELQAWLARHAPRLPLWRAIPRQSRALVSGNAGHPGLADS